MMLILLQVVLLTLKLAGVIAWAWWLVLLPVLILAAMWLLGFVVSFAIAYNIARGLNL